MKFRTIALVTALLIDSSAFADSFTWIRNTSGNASGSWGSQTNWSGGALPTTSADTVCFNTLDLTSSSTVTLDGSRTVNSLLFSDADTGTTANWFINAGSPSTSYLTLDGQNPTIKVSGLGAGAAAIFNIPILGTNGFTKTGGDFLQLNGASAYSGQTILSGADCRISCGNAKAFGGSKVVVGAYPGDGQIWFNAAGAQTLTNDFEIRTIRWIIDYSIVNNIAAGNLTLNGNVLLNNGSDNVRDIYPNGKDLTINGNVTAASAVNPLNKDGGGLLTLNGTNFIKADSYIKSGTFVLNGLMNGGARFTVNSGAQITGTGRFSGPLSIQNGATISPGNYGSGTLTCGGLVSEVGALFNFKMGATNDPNNALIVVNGDATISGILNITDLGGFAPGVYTGFQYSGSISIGGLTNGTIPGGRAVVFDTNSAPGFVLFRVMTGKINPTPGQKLPMDLASPLPLSWLNDVRAMTYDVYFGSASNEVANATTNTSGVYQGRVSVNSMNMADIQPGTSYFWRVDTVVADGTVIKGIVYSFVTGAAMQDLMEDTWVATDAVGRTLPGIGDCGSPRTNRPIGLFYYLWHHDYSYGSGTNWDVSRYIQQHPYTNPHNPWADSPIMDTAKATYWWGEPELGYYDPSDPWVLRRQIALLNHAGVDVLIFDYSNAVTYDTQLYALLDMIRQMRFEGNKINLKIAFLTYANSGSIATYLYNNFYGAGKYSDLWFYWQGKPLILGYVNGNGSTDTAPSSTVRNFFTWRRSWAYVATTDLQDQWQWVDVPTPQNWGYDTRTDLPEEVPVSCGGWASGNIGKSQCNNLQQDYDKYHLPLQRTSGLGIFFKEQMNYGLKYDPQFLFITQWNEWIAGSFASPSACAVHLLADCCPVNGFYFVDEYNQEYSRDLEPMKGGHTDNYYFQMVGQNRMRKGVRPVPAASAHQSINVSGDVSQWNSVQPAYYDATGDTIPRNRASSVSQVGTYKNTTGRNDFRLLKVARDADYFYFMAQCSSNITSPNGSNWMVLFIDADQDHHTGWEGYDFAVNLGGVSASTTTLFLNTTTTNGWNWTPVRSDIAYSVNGSQLTLAVPRSSLGLVSDPVNFDFHWADNFQTNDIADFAVNGDSAPDRRFNYRYTTGSNDEVTLLADDFESGRRGIWGVTWTNGSQWSLSPATPYSGQYSAVCNGGSGPSTFIARTNTAGFGGMRLEFHYKLHNISYAQNLRLYYQGTNGWVPIRELSRDEFYPIGQSWGYNEKQDVWLRFYDSRTNNGSDAQFFTTNFAFRIDASVLTASSNILYVDDVKLTGYTQTPQTGNPQIWRTCDVGNAGNLGSVSTNNGVISMSGPGLDIGNKGDAFRFFYQTRAGDGTFTVRVANQTQANGWSKAGVMIRESLDTGSRHAFMGITPGSGVNFRRRTVAMNATDSTNITGITAPCWVRIMRSSRTNFTGYYSKDGQTWSLLGTTSIADFSGTAFWGLAATARNNNTNSVATFDNVQIIQTPMIMPVPDQSIFAGQTLTWTNGILNPSIPASSLTWTLSSAPIGVTLDAASGVLAWRPTMAQALTTNTIAFKVADGNNRVGSQSFLATVIPPANPLISGFGYVNGQLTFTVGGTAGPDYYILASTNLVDWVPLQQSVSPVVPFSFSDPGYTNFNQRFYKVQLGPIQ